MDKKHDHKKDDLKNDANGHNSKIKDHNKALEEMQDQVNELKNNWKRALADYKNLEKRLEEEKLNTIQFANMLLISRLLSVYDNLEMLEQHNDDMGLKMITREFKQILKEEGLQEIGAEDQDFDANTMEAIDKVPGEENKVVQILRKGFFLKDKLLRPARVNVGNGEIVEKN